MHRIVLSDVYGRYSGKVLEEIITADAIQKRISEMAVLISEEYKDSTPIMIGVLNGSFIFLSDLIRRVEPDCEVDFIKISSYTNGIHSSGTVRLLKDISCNITGRDVIVVEDIIDSGLSVKFLRKRMEESEPRSVKFATLLLKESARVPFTIDYVGFQVSNEYVVGYGLDLEQKLRKLESIYILKEE